MKLFEIGKYKKIRRFSFANWRWATVGERVKRLDRARFRLSSNYLYTTKSFISYVKKSLYFSSKLKL